jgi:hypothetical protein
MDSDSEDFQTEDKPANINKMAKISFFTDLPMMAIQWGNSVGSMAFDDNDLKLIFEVPWKDLLEGKPITVTIPHEHRNGTWTIRFQRK